MSHNRNFALWGCGENSARSPLPRRCNDCQSAQYRTQSYSGAPRSMKMGTIRSPWRYDVTPWRAHQQAVLRWPTISRCARSERATLPWAMRVFELAAFVE